MDIKKISDEIIDQYLNDANPRPWIVGFSGGKDSTMLLQLVWYALKKIDPHLRKRFVYVINNNTLVENPKILKYSEKIVALIAEAASQQEMPILAEHTTPRLEDTFWVNMIGKGYPAPNNTFRWCTERLKINPTTKFIKEKITENGEAIILLGTRLDESSKRASSIKKHEIYGTRLRKHSLPNAFVYSPIIEVKTDEVWQYLMQVDSPWGASNKELLHLYREADGGDCPLVIDTSTPSCGNSRFGCWTCTVVQKDKSMEAMIENGEEWLVPLVEIRDYLHETRYNHDCREVKYINGERRVGPYKPEIRSEILKRILKAQKEISAIDSELELITYQELVAIQVHWFRKNIFEYNVGDIYYEVFNKSIHISTSDGKFEQEKMLLKDHLGNDDKFKLVNELLDIQQSKTLLLNRLGIHNDIEIKLEQFIADQKVNNVS
jgi:DNA sulfur modification protein DndC